MDDVSAQIQAFGIVNSLLSECIGVEVSSEVFNLKTRERVPSSTCTRICGSTCSIHDSSGSCGCATVAVDDDVCGAILTVE
jgi:hypothetical protein